jgi:cytidylate kinase
MKKIIIAIDGFSSTGKSTLAKEIARLLGYIYVDSGAMYRAVTLFAIENQITHKDKIDKSRLVKVINDLKIEFRLDANNKNVLFLNDKKVETNIRSMVVSNLVSSVAVIPEIRKSLVKEQRRLGMNKGIVMDGRDIGTVVFPEAELKIFMTASKNIRAKRRYDELISSGSSVKFEDVLININKRDQNDSSRKNSPLVKAKDAIILDNSKLSKEDQLELVFSWIHKLIK